MPGKRVEIDQLLLRVPGQDAASGRLLAREVSERLARQIPEQVMNRSLGALSVRVSASESETPVELADRIAAAILRGIR